MRARLRNIIRILYEAGARVYLAPLLRYEFKQRARHAVTEQATDLDFALRAITTWSPVEILDVGTGRVAWPHLLASAGYNVTAIDKVDGYWHRGLFNRHFRIIRDDITQSRLTGPYDFITCTSALQHVSDPDAAVGEMFRLLKPGGFLVLTFPYCEDRSVANVYELAESTYGSHLGVTCRVFSRQDVNRWLETWFELLEQEYFQVFTGALWTFGDRVSPPRRVGRTDLHQRTALLMRRHG